MIPAIELKRKRARRRERQQRQAGGLVWFVRRHRPSPRLGRDGDRPQRAQQSQRAPPVRKLPTGMSAKGQGCSGLEREPAASAASTSQKIEPRRRPTCVIRARCTQRSRGRRTSREAWMVRLRDASSMNGPQGHSGCSSTPTNCQHLTRRRTRPSTPTFAGDTPRTWLCGEAARLHLADATAVSLLRSLYQMASATC